MRIKPIKTEGDYDAALERIAELFNAKPNTQEGDELEVLITLVSAYEDIHYHIDAPDPLKPLNILWRRRGWKIKT